jgi:hypothetical protein
VKTRAWLVSLVLLVAVAATTDFASAQCAMCKTVLTGSEEGRTLQGELNRAILMMIAAPYLVFGTVGVVLFRKPLGSRLSRLAGRLRRRTPNRDVASS